MNTNRFFLATNAAMSDSKTMKTKVERTKEPWENPQYDESHHRRDSGGGVAMMDRSVGDLLTQYANGWVRPKLLWSGFLPSLIGWTFVPLLMVMYWIWNGLSGGYMVTSGILSLVLVWEYQRKIQPSSIRLPFLRIFLGVCLLCRLILPLSEDDADDDAVLLNHLTSMYFIYCLPWSFAMFLASMAVASTYIGNFAIVRLSSFPEMVDGTKKKTSSSSSWMGHENIPALLIIHALAGWGSRYMMLDPHHHHPMVTWTCVLAACTSIYGCSSSNHLLIQPSSSSIHRILPSCALIIPILSYGMSACISISISSSSRVVDWRDIGISYVMTIGWLCYSVGLHQRMQGTCRQLIICSNNNSWMKGMEYMFSQQFLPQDVMIQSILVGFGPTLVQQIIEENNNNNNNNNITNWMARVMLDEDNPPMKTTTLEHDLLRFAILSSLHHHSPNNNNNNNNEQSSSSLVPIFQDVRMAPTLLPVLRALCAYCSAFGQALTNSASSSSSFYPGKNLSLSLASCKAVEHAILATSQWIVQYHHHQQQQQHPFLLEILFQTAHQLTCGVLDYTQQQQLLPPNNNNNNNDNKMMTLEHYIAWKRRHDLRGILLACETAVQSVVPIIITTDDDEDDYDFQIQKYTASLSKDCAHWIHHQLSLSKQQQQQQQQEPFSK